MSRIVVLAEPSPFTPVAGRMQRVRLILRRLACLLSLWILCCNPKVPPPSRVGTDPMDMSPSCARMHELMLGGRMPLNLMAVKWPILSPQEERLLADRLEKWSQQAVQTQLDLPWANEEIHEMGKLAHGAAALQRDEAIIAAGNDSNARLKAHADLTSVSRGLIKGIQDIATRCDFSPPTNISRQTASDALTQESGAICWCMGGTSRFGLGLSGRVDALATFGTDGKVTQVKPWGQRSRDIESLISETVVVAEGPQVAAWNELTDISTKKCVLQSLRELSIPPPTGNVAVLYSVLLGPPANTSLLPSDKGSMPRRYCR